MIVCVCNRVSERDIAQAVRAGHHQFDAMCAETRVASCCGRCRDCARDVFDAACTRQSVAGPVGAGPSRPILLYPVQA